MKGRRRSGFIFCLRGNSRAFRPGFGPGLFDPCVGPHEERTAVVVACPFTASGTGPRWTKRAVVSFGGFRYFLRLHFISFFNTKLNSYVL